MLFRRSYVIAAEGTWACFRPPDPPSALASLYGGSISYCQRGMPLSQFI